MAFLTKVLMASAGLLPAVQFLKRYSGDSEQIELERSAFYRIGEETFYLRIPPEEKNKIVIRKVE